MREEEDIDALARNLLLSEGVTPPDTLWAGIASRLDAVPVRRPPFFILRLRWMALLYLLVIPAAVLMFRYFPEAGREEAKQYTGRNAASVAGSGPNVNAERAAAADTADGDTAIGTSRAILQNGAELIAIAAKAKTKKIRSSEGHRLEMPPRKEVNHLISSFGDTVRASHGSDIWPSDLASDASSAPDAGEVALFSFAHTDAAQSAPSWLTPKGTVAHGDKRSAFIAERTPRELYGPEPRRGWFAGFYFDARSTSLHIQPRGEGSAQVVDSLRKAEIASIQPGAGLIAGYHIHPRWRISGGVAFAKWCRTTAYPVAFDVPAGYLHQNNDPGTNIPLEQEIYSATGVQVLRLSAPSQVVMEALQAVATNSAFPYPLEIKECYDLLQLPFTLEYYHASGRFGLLPGFGFTYEHVLKRSAELVGSGSGEVAGTVFPVEKSPENFLSLSASLHAEYLITERLSLRGGIACRAWLTAVYSGDLLKTYPRIWSVDAGLVYHFYRKEL